MWWAAKTSRQIPSSYAREDPRNPLFGERDVAAVLDGGGAALALREVLGFACSRLKARRYSPRETASGS
jgi:hypothetical protein